MQQLEREERLRLMKFVCSFAWTDLEVNQAERSLVERMLARSGMSATDCETVREWLAVPPPIEEVDPLEIPIEHRELFLNAARAMVAVDGEVREGEQDTLDLFEELMHPDD